VASSGKRGGISLISELKTPDPASVAHENAAQQHNLDRCMTQPKLCLLFLF
jgi:hypothetical protein